MTVKNVSLSKATFVKFRAQSVDFLEVSNPRALLEVSLRKFTCLTVGDTICIPYSGKRFYLDVREVQPNSAASIIETDCNVDFEEPLGYQDSKYAQYEREKKAKDSPVTVPAAPRVLQKARVDPTEEEIAAANSFKPFSGSARRIDGKLPQSVLEAKAAGLESSSPSTTSSSSTGIYTSKARAEAKDSAPEPSSASGFQSRIGDKYSKKKAAVSAFTGTAHKLNG